MSTLDELWDVLDDAPRLDVDLIAAGLRERLKPQPWAEQALCAQSDPEAWFPEKGSSAREAVAICQRCPVAAECLDYALANGERFGIWGAVSEHTRRRLTQPNPAA